MNPSSVRHVNESMKKSQGTIPAQATPFLGAVVVSFFQGCPSRVRMQVIVPDWVGLAAVKKTLVL